MLLPARSKFSSLKSSQTRANRNRHSWQQLALEPLESRHLLTTTVTTLADVTDGDINDGTVSLRDAVALAPESDTINFDSGLDFSQSLILSLGELVIDRALTIDGPADDTLTIDAQGNSRLFNVTAPLGTTVSFSQLTSTGGSTSSHGGAIYAEYADIQLDNSVVTGNSAGEDGGGIYGGIFSGSSITLTNSTVSGNSAGDDGGGIYSFYSTALTNSTVSGNTAAQYGGGVSSGGGAVVVSYSTIYDNLALVYGGGIYAANGSATITASIVSGNSLATSLDGGGNVVGTAPDDLFGNSLTVRYSFIGINLNTNLIASPDSLDGNGNYIGSEAAPIVAALGDLTDNGGLTQTHLPLPDSRVVDTISTNITNSGNPPPNDQRGAPFQRFFGTQSFMDMGAVERQTIDASNFVVSTLEDTIDGDLSAGDVSLREAIAAANGSPGQDTITFDTAGLFATPQTITIGSVLEVTDAITLNGPGADQLTIDAQNRSGIFNSVPSNEFGIFENMISNVTLTRGAANYGGAIRTSSPLTIQSSTISDSTATQSGGGVHADAGIFLTVNDSTISGNSAGYLGGGLNAGYLTVSRSTISGNSAYLGGGTNSYAQTSLDASTVNDNQATYRGGGVAIYALGTVTNSTISGNIAGDQGGGLFVYGDLLTLRYSTVAFNTTGVEDGGGGISINDVNGVARGDSLFASIDANNVWQYGYSTPGGPVSISISDNLRGNNFNASYSFIGTSDNHNLEASPTTPDANGNLIGGVPTEAIDPRLDLLMDNGGPMMTHAPRANSPVIDMGNPAAANGTGNVPASDQRQAPFVRVAEGTSGAARIDMGAVERQSLGNGSFVVNTIDDELDTDLLGGATLSLREAIVLANFSAGTDTITFDTSVFGSPQTISLMMGQMEIRESVTVNGPEMSLTIDAQGNSRHFRIYDGNVDTLQQATISGLTLTGGTSSYGGSIYSSENLAISDSVFTNNNVMGGQGFGSGGAIAMTVYQEPMPLLTISGSRLTGNAAPYAGGAIDAYNATITGSTISGNSAGTLGGGINAFGTITLGSSTISGNTAGTNGGGLASYLPVTLTSSTLSGNSAASNGGGLFVYTSQTGPSMIDHSTITNNMATTDGGGLYLNTYDPTNSAVVGSAVINNSIVAGNSAGSSAGDLNGTISGTHSLVQDVSGATINGTAFVTGASPLLENLADNGGATQTHALMTGSPAINAGDPDVAAPPEFDQRGTGFTRVLGGRIDMGAFETESLSWHNAANPFDVNADDVISPTDAIITINELNDRMISSPEDGSLPVTADAPPFLDVNDDGFVSPTDPIQIINKLNEGSTNLFSAPPLAVTIASFEVTSPFNSTSGSISIKPVTTIQRIDQVFADTRDTEVVWASSPAQQSSKDQEKDDEVDSIDELFAVSSSPTDVFRFV